MGSMVPVLMTEYLVATVMLSFRAQNPGSPS